MSPLAPDTVERPSVSSTEPSTPSNTINAGIPRTSNLVPIDDIIYIYCYYHIKFYEWYDILKKIIIDNIYNLHIYIINSRPNACAILLSLNGIETHGMVS